MFIQSPSLSFEVFPPNPAVGNEKIMAALKEMQDSGEFEKAVEENLGSMDGIDLGTPGDLSFIK